MSKREFTYHALISTINFAKTIQEQQHEQIEKYNIAKGELLQNLRFEYITASSQKNLKQLIRANHYKFR